MIGKYTQADLTHGGDAPEEHERLRGIFDDLIARGKAGEKLSRIEQDFVFHGIEYFNENENNYPFVDEARFANNYLTYGFDPSGGSIYERVRDQQIIQVPPLERDNDLTYLRAKAKQWQDLVDPKHLYGEELMKEVAKEARNDRKELDKELNIAGRPDLAGSFYYMGKTEKVYLRAAANYTFGKKYWESTDPADCIFLFCGEEIEFTEVSLIHILNRHFAELGKPYSSGKDYHTEDIIPWALASQVKQIMTEIDKSGHFTKQHDTKINLKYKGETYEFWAQYQTKSVRGKGNVTYKRVQSFYPVSKPSILSDLRTNYREVVISGGLSVFVP